jgi:multicomponent Na+:H+ antiporter subunit G
VDVSAVSAALLAIAVAAVALTAAGVLISRNVYQRLHYLGPASTIGVAATAAAIVAQEGWDQAGIKAVVVAGLLLVVNPILSHATARATRVHQRGHWEEDPPR